MSVENIHRPEHYNNYGFTPIDAFHAGLMSPEETRGFLKGNVIKYIVRYNKKGGILDLEKAREYIDLLVKFEKKEEDI